MSLICLNLIAKGQDKWVRVEERVGFSLLFLHTCSKCGMNKMLKNNKKTNWVKLGARLSWLKEGTRNTAPPPVSRVLLCVLEISFISLSSLLYMIRRQATED